MGRRAGEDEFNSAFQLFFTRKPFLQPSSVLQGVSASASSSKVSEECAAASSPPAAAAAPRLEDGEWYEIAPFDPRDRHRSISYRSSERDSGGNRSSRRSRRRKKTLWQKFKDFLRSLFTFIFSSVGICVLVNVYLFLVS